MGEVIQIRAIDVIPHHYDYPCLVGDDRAYKEIAIVGRRWSKDGSRIILWLDTHNVAFVLPDEEVMVVRRDARVSDALLAKWDAEDAAHMALRPTGGSSEK